MLERGARAVLAGKRVPQARQHHSMVMGASLCLLRPPTRATLEDEKIKEDKKILEDEKTLKMKKPRR